MSPKRVGRVTLIGSWISPTVSVVIPHYGDSAPTLVLLDQLRAQDGAELQLIVADDCSPIPFPETPGVTVVRRAQNGGFGCAVNSGAEAATGELLLILNSDLEIGPGFVRDLVTAAQPWQPAVAGPRIVDGAGHADWTARRFPTTAHQVTEWLTPLARVRHTAWWHRGVGHDVAPEPGHATVTDWLVGAVLLLPLAAFRESGGFDERFHMNSEEVDLQRRLGARGIPSVYLPMVTVTHVGGGSSDPVLRRRWLVTSRLRYAEKWGGLVPLRLGLSLATPVNAVANGARRLRGAEVDPLRTAREEWSLIWQKEPR